MLAQVSYPYLRGIEDGIRTGPSIALLTRLASVYGRDVRELLTHAPDRAGTR